MMPISGVNTGAAQSLTAAEKVLGVAENRRSEKEAQGGMQKPSMDVYIPEEKQEPFGRYWMGKDKDGRPKIYFDDPEQAADTPEKPEDVPNAKKPDDVSTSAERPGQSPDAEEPEGSGKKEERWMGDTSKVDREIEKLKKRQKELEQRINTETDETKIKELERQLAQVERELNEKDNDAYRKQHSTCTRLS